LRAAAAWRAGSPLYPASAQRCCGRRLVGLGRWHTNPSKVDSSSFMSCTLAPPATSDSGTPRPSVSRLRLRPFFPRSVGFPPRALGGQRRFSHGPVDALPLPGDALHAVVFGQSRLPQLEEKTRLVPVLKMLVHRAGTAELPGQRFPLASGAQNVHDGGEDPPRRHGLAPASRLAPVGLFSRPLPRWNQRLQLRPQLIRYCPRLDLFHPGRYLRPSHTFGLRLSAFQNQDKHYLRISSKNLSTNSAGRRRFGPWQPAEGVSRGLKPKFWLALMSGLKPGPIPETRTTATRVRLHGF
jgi:hypothetical protein